ncbi:hypothetical protein SCHPADRAFT_745134 [Schizopora paradoxa]|uniref:Uncharacterized protein n=1 Tax=Schizopora paradoxa TaxID=27342 RepID=A0A0H2R5M8_9AGAM|nr:hypothetical protein SCHPADRAFT_745134 [Schizopora paradoxa]
MTTTYHRTQLLRGDFRRASTRPYDTTDARSNTARPFPPLYTKRKRRIDAPLASAETAQNRRHQRGLLAQANNSGAGLLTRSRSIPSNL